jgi:hypothetical protein
VRCRDATASSFVAKVRGEVFAHFHIVAVEVIVICRIYCLACQDEFFVNNPLDVKERDENAFDFALHLPCLFSVSVSSDFPFAAHAFFPERLSNYCRLSVAIFPRCSQNLMHTCCRIHREIASGHTRLRLKGHKKISTSTQLLEILYSDTQDVLVLLSTIALRYYNCCTDSSTSPRSCGHSLLIRYTMYRPVFDLKHNATGTGFSPCSGTGTSSVDWA